MPKEWSEWITSWCACAPQKDLPRVLLVGDSITQGYQSEVRKLLDGVAYVDHIATSYAVDSKIYNTLIKNFAADSEYTLIHFNHGLHGIHMSKRTYKSRLKKLLATLGKNSKIMLATSTVVYQSGNKRLHAQWMKRVKERNVAMSELCTEYGYSKDDLYAVSLSIAKDCREEDGTHYVAEGYKTLAAAVAESIKNALKV